MGHTYMRFKDPSVRTARMTVRNWQEFVELSKDDTSPGDGWYAIVKVLPRPVPKDGEELGWTYTVDPEGVVVYKEYFINKIPRRWSRLSIKGALADAHMLPVAKSFLSAFEVKPDYTAWEALTDCDYIEEGYGGPEKWNAVLDGMAQAFYKTRPEVDAFLDSLPTE